MVVLGRSGGMTGFFPGGWIEDRQVQVEFTFEERSKLGQGAAIKYVYCWYARELQHQVDGRRGVCCRTRHQVGFYAKGLLDTNNGKRI